MTQEQLKKWSEGHSPSRIVEIQTKEHTRRGLFHGVQPDGKAIFLWIPNISPQVKSIDSLQMEAVAMIVKYEPKQVLSIK